jgi:hypothetical protein
MVQHEFEVTFKNTGCPKGSTSQRLVMTAEHTDAKLDK